MLKNLLEKVKELLKAKNVEVTDEMEKDLESKIKDVVGDKLDDQNIDLKKILDDDSGKDNEKVINALIEQNKVLMQNVKNLQATLADENKAREEAKEIAKKQAEKDFDKKIKDRVEKAYKDKLITESEKEGWEKKLKTNFDMADEFLKNMEPKKQFKNDDKTGDDKGGDDKKPENEYRGLVNDAKNLLEDSINETAR